MLIIAERINATRQRVREALAARDAAFLQQEARRQADAGADFLDVNAALDPRQERDLMAWAVETVRDAAGVPLSVDTANPDACRRARPS